MLLANIQFGQEDQARKVLQESHFELYNKNIKKPMAISVKSNGPLFISLSKWNPKLQTFEPVKPAFKDCLTSEEGVLLLIDEGKFHLNPDVLVTAGLPYYSLDCLFPLNNKVVRRVFGVNNGGSLSARLDKYLKSPIFNQVMMFNDDRQFLGNKLNTPLEPTRDVTVTTTTEDVNMTDQKHASAAMMAEQPLNNPCAITEDNPCKDFPQMLKESGFENNRKYSLVDVHTPAFQEEGVSIQLVEPSFSDCDSRTY